MRASAIIVAAGAGRRLGMDVPKAFAKLAGHSMLYHSMRTLASVGSVAEAVVTVPAGMEAAARVETEAAGVEVPVKLVAGGAERQDSVRIALDLTSAESELVIVHDAARPFATAELFEACLEAARRAGCAIAAIPVSDTLKRVQGRTIQETVSRRGLYRAQTPQAFRRDLLVTAHRRARLDGVAATDDAELVERLGATVEVVEGSPANLKIATRADLELAEFLASTRRAR